MKLADYLRTSGFTKAGLSRALDVSRQAISKWDDIPEKYLDELNGLEPEKEVPMAVKLKSVKDFTMDEIREICKRRGGLEGIQLRDRVKNGNMRKEDDEFLPLETGWEISRSLGLSLKEYRTLILRYVEFKRSERQKESKGEYAPEYLDGFIERRGFRAPTDFRP